MKPAGTIYRNRITGTRWRCVFANRHSWWIVVHRVDDATITKRIGPWLGLFYEREEMTNENR